MGSHGIHEAYRRQSKRMREMDQELRRLGAMYVVYRNLFNAAMAALRSQSELLRAEETPPVKGQE